jgi:glycosyltransferase involved in cell wall biosynthesis
MRKILIFSLNYFPKYVGGAEVAIKEIVERQDKNKFEFHMLTLRFDSNLPKYEVVHGIHVHRIGFVKKDATISDLKNSWLKYNKYFYQLFGAFYAMKLHLKFHFDGVWAMMAHSCGVPAGIFKMFFPRVKYILTLQEGDPPEHIEKLARPFFPPISTISYWFFKNGFKRADIVQSISTFLNTWAGKMGNESKKVIIPNAVDVKQFTRNIREEEIQNVKNKLQKKDSEIWLITTSRQVLKNGVDNVIEAISKLPENYHFAILGIGPDENKHRELAKKLNIENRVHFLGEVKHPEMAIYLRACDIFIRPSRSEGMGNSFVEAMSMKLPVVATREGGLADFIFENETKQTAWVCEKDNSESILNAVNRIEKLKKDNLDKYNKIISDSYKMVQEKYDWEIIAKRMEKEVFDLV